MKENEDRKPKGFTFKTRLKADKRNRASAFAYELLKAAEIIL
jgi:hypothetical protein